MLFLRSFCVGLVVSALGCAQILGLEESTVVDGGAADSSISDSTASDTSVATDSSTVDVAPETPSETPPSITLFFAAPDQAKSYVCIDVFGDPAPAPPTAAYGPYGSPTGFAYPSTFPIPKETSKNFASKQIAVIVVDTDPGTDPEICKKLYKDTMMATPKRVVNFPAGSLKSGEAYAIALTGCAGMGSTLFGACGPGSNLGLSSVKLDPASPPSGKLSVQVLDLSVYDDSTMPGPPNLKKVDGYLDSYDGKTKRSEDKVASSVDALTVAPRVDVTPPPGSTSFLVLYPPGTTSPCAFTPETMPAMGCVIAPVDLQNALVEARTHDAATALSAGQSLVIAFTGTSKGDMTKPPDLFGLIGRIR
ncbi:MAG: hypothetical protein ACXVEF_20720 [Polyangiales bacterium]